MGYMEWNCPACGQKNRDSCNAWGYGSPVRYCKKCQAEFFDNRWREVAIDGFDPRSMNSGLYLKGTIGSAVFAAVMAGYVAISIKTRGSYSIRAAGCIALGVIASVMCLIVYIRIKSGYEEKDQAHFLEESRDRLRDPAYVQKLMQYGVQIPAEYRTTQEEQQP